jgi:Ras-related protein Rab-7A
LYRKVKVLILGDPGVGKTSILNQFVVREFTPHYHPTIGADYVSRQIEIDGTFLTLQIWETAGQERFRSLGSSFYRGTEICVFVCDITSESSFLSIESWFNVFQQECNPLPINLPFPLVGKKMDDIKQRVVTTQSGTELAKKYDFIFYKVSAKSCDNITDAFEAGGRKYLNLKTQKLVEISITHLEIDQNEQPKEKHCHC